MNKNEEQYVYIFTNNKHEGLIKVGKTDRHPEVRLWESNKKTENFGRFQLEWYCIVPDAKIAEDILHNKLKAYRETKEYFRISFKEAIIISENSLKDFFKEGLEFWQNTKTLSEEEKKEKLVALDKKIRGFEVLLKREKDKDKKTALEEKLKRFNELKQELLRK